MARDSMTRLSPPAQAAGRDTAASAAVRRFRISPLGWAVVAAFGLWSTQSQALTLGALNVLSALGEPLRAEVQVTDVTQAEATNLQVRLAAPQTFQNAGLTFADTLQGVRTTLQRRADGGYVVRLEGVRPMNDPFVDILIEANSPSGRLVRDYTALIDPPQGRAPATSSGVAIDRPITPAPTRQAPRAERPTAIPAQAAAAPAPAAAPPGAASAITVRAGDTAGRLAAAAKPADVSLDQMLLAMLRANPSAFMNGNVNRLRAGAVLQMPSADAARATPPEEARRTIVAQSRDFNSYRQRLATNAPSMNVEGADRQASGGLQARVQDRSAAGASADRLTISRGAAPGQASAEERLAQQRQAKESSSRVAELSRNIEELNRLQGASSGASAGTAAPAQAAPAGPSAPQAAAPSEGTAGGTGAPGVTAPSTTGSASSTPAATAPTPQAAASGGAAVALPAPPASAAVAPAPVPPAPSAAQEEQGLLDSLLANPLMLAGGGIVLLLLLLALLARRRQQQKKDAAESLFPESLQKDSYFGGSGGATVDTKEDHSGASSLNYSPSQLDAGDVDPVAEADVYLAYGRDLQAEEILKEALRTSPERTSIQLKLLEIYARRRDARAFEQLALELQGQTGGKGSDWHRAQELGRSLDPSNALYQGAHAADAPAAALPAGLAPAMSAAGIAASASAAGAMSAPREEPKPQAFVPSVAPLDFDLDLDLPPARTPAAAPAPTTPSVSSLFPSALADDARPVPGGPASGLRGAADEPTIPAPLRSAPVGDLGNDFDTAPAELEPMAGFRHVGDEVHTQPATLHAPLSMEGSDIFSRDFHAALNTADTQPMDLPLHIPTGIDPGPGESADAVKLSLARELHALGDPEGARMLLEELIAESDGALQEDARRLLAELR